MCDFLSSFWRRVVAGSPGVALSRRSRLTDIERATFCRRSGDKMSQVRVVDGDPGSGIRGAGRSATGVDGAVDGTVDGTAWWAWASKEGCGRRGAAVHGPIGPTWALRAAPRRPRAGVDVGRG